MKTVFLSNYYNHHQAPFSEAMYKLTQGEYRFIACEQIEAERVKMGWGEIEPRFVLHLDESYKECIELIENADVVIFGSAPYELVRSRIKKKKITFIYTERIDKKKEDLLRFIKHYFDYNVMYRFHSSLFCLCASAYTSYDFSKRRCFINKAYKWGYFPVVKKYEEINKLVEDKEPASILWTGRLIGLKHPDASIRLAVRLKEEGFRFKLRIIGNGEMQVHLQKMIEENNLCDCVQMLGSMKPNQVREYMEKSQIFLFTSDRNEGWGAVLNESMNSGCTVIASHAIGSVPFLLTNGVNGLVYCDGNEEELFQKVKYALDNQMMCKSMGGKAYETLVDAWNAEEAARRLLLLIDDLENNGKSDRFENGPCSKAEIIKDGWYR